MKHEPPITIVKSSVDFVESFNRAVDTIARERKYLATVHGFTLESSQSFLTWVSQADLAQYFMIKDNSVVGWCDIIPKPIPEFSHVGVLGMGILAEYRGMGFGRKLMDITINHASSINKLEKIELNVYDTNTEAIILYRKMGFFEEGIRMRARKIDGVYQNEILMGKYL